MSQDIAAFRGQKVALPMKSVREILAGLPELELAQIEDTAGELLKSDFKLEHRVERNVIGAVVAVMVAFLKKGVNLHGVAKDERVAALYAFSLVRQRVRESFATRDNQVEGGTYVFNFPLPTDDASCEVVQDLYDNARLAYPPDAQVTIPPFKLRFLGAVTNSQAHSVPLLEQAEVRQQARKNPESSS